MRTLGLLGLAFLLGGCPSSGPDHPPTIVSFTTSSDTVAFGGGDVTLAWTVADATTLGLSEVGDVTGTTSQVVHVKETTTFTLTANNKKGTDSASLKVTVQVPTTPPTISGFTANPATLPLGGGNVTLLWSQNLATSLFIDNGVGDVSGKSQKGVNVKQTTTFTLTATNPLGSVTATTTVTVYVPSSLPVINAFTASPSALGAGGGTTTLSWSAIDAASYRIEPGVGTVTGTSKQVTVRETTTFTIIANNIIGDSQPRQTTVTVNIPTQPPSISYFTASPTTVAAGGGNTTLSWSVSEAATVSIDHGVGTVSGSGSRTVYVDRLTSFQLTATNLVGSSVRSVSVDVAPNPPVIVSFTASPTSVQQGGTTRLSWSVSGATSVSLDHGFGPVSGTSIDVVVNGPITYTLTATNAAGASVSRSVSITIRQAPPVITSFTASRSSVFPGETVTLSWGTSNATSLALNNGIGPVTGSSIQVQVNGAVTYTLTASNSAGSVSRSVSISTQQSLPVINSFISSRTSVSPGESATLSWSTSSATSLSLNNSIGPVTGSSLQVTPFSTTTYILTATNSAGSVTRSVTISVGSSGPSINSFTASPSSLSSAGTSTLFWSVSGASSLSLSNGFGPVTGSSLEVFVSTTTTFVLTATSSSGQSTTRSVTITVGGGGGGNRTINGRVIFEGAAIGEQGAYVDILGVDTVTTDSNGNFTIGNAPATFDIVVSDSTNRHITVYRKVTRANPTLVHYGVFPDVSYAGARSGTVSLSNGGSVQPGTLVMFAGDGALSNIDSVGNGTSYSFPTGDLAWYGGKASGYLYGFDGFGQGTARVGRSALVTLDSAARTVNFALPQVDTFHLSGNCSKPSGYTISWKRSGLTLSPNNAVHFEAVNSSSAFDLYSADVSGANAFVSCQASDGMRTLYARQDAFTRNTSNIALQLIEAPILGSPSNNGSAGYGDTFSWQPFGDGAHILHITPADDFGAEIHIVTGDASSILPDLSQIGLALTSGAHYKWSVDGYAPLWDADAATNGNTLFNLLSDQGTYQRGLSRTYDLYLD